jgi:hypothetical protein
MNRFNRGFLVMLVASLGLWGCARSAADHGASAERIRKLELECARWKQDYHDAAKARDVQKERAKTSEAERARLEKELEQQQTIVKERDVLRDQLASRVSERDLLQQRCDRLKKGLQNLLGQDEALAPGGTRSSGISLLTSR